MNHERNQRLQELLAISVQHIRKQGRPSLNGFGCAYRGDDGAQCAAAPFITDYTPEMDNGENHFKAVLEKWPLRVLPAARDEPDFVRWVLQMPHDKASRDGDNFLASYHSALAEELSKFNERNGTCIVLPPAAAMGRATF